ncbi:MAG: hypothetical protein GWP10_21370 [Nitrospiraceae bacterium]|nr:hypothetical protein [Nitrospiraceae bacterium]
MELLIATAISAIVITTAYSIFNGIRKVSVINRKNEEYQSLIPNIYMLFLRDIESINRNYGKIEVSEGSNETEVLSFFTDNCYFTGGICYVKYWIYQKDEFNVLIRTEYKLNSTTNLGIDVPITSKIRDFKVFFASNGDWIDGRTGINPSLIKITTYLSNNQTIPMIFKVRD